MAVTVYIPTPFRRATNNRDRIESTAPTVGGLLDELEDEYVSLRGLVRNDSGEVHHHVNIYVNSEAIDALSGLDTPLKDGDEVTIIPALAGGGGSAWQCEVSGAPLRAEPFNDRNEWRLATSRALQRSKFEIQNSRNA